MMTMNNQYSAASLYDGGWRTEDRDQMIDEYGLTADEADDICKELAAIKDGLEQDLAGELDEMIALGWTEEEAKDDPEAFLDRIGEEYKEGLTEKDIWRVWKNVLEIEEEATAKEFEDYGKLKYINPEAFYEEGWSIAGQAEDEDGDAYDIVLSADKTEYRYTNI